MILKTSVITLISIFMTLNKVIEYSKYMKWGKGKLDSHEFSKINKQQFINKKYEKHNKIKVIGIGGCFSYYFSKSKEFTDNLIYIEVEVDVVYSLGFSRYELKNLEKIKISIEKFYVDFKKLKKKFEYMSKY